MLRRAVLAAFAVAFVTVPSTPLLAANDDGFPSGKASAWKRVTTTGLPDTPNFATVIGDRFVVLLDLPAGGFAPYTSENGRRWRRVDVPQEVFPSDAVVQSVSSGSKGIIVAGSVGPDNQSALVFWRSRNGMKWRRTTADPSVFGGPGANAGVNGVVQGPSGYVAVGYDGTGSGLDAAVWTSPDATDWTRVTPAGGLLLASPGEQGFTMLDVTYARRTFVAVGLRRFFTAAGTLDEEPAVWTSRDARTWTRRTDGVAIPPAFVPDSQGVMETRLSSVVATGRGFAAIGNQRDSEEGTNIAGFVVFSADGTRWTLARAGGRPFAFAPTATDQTAVRYVDRTGGGAVVSGITRHSGSVPSTARIWVTDDGRSWRSLEGAIVDGYVEGPVMGAARGAVVLGYPFRSDGTPTVAWRGGKP